MRTWWLGVGVVLGVTGLAALILYLTYDNLPAYFQGVAVETGGVFLEVLLLLAAFGGYEQYRARRENIVRLRDRIDDVKRIDDPHAHGIIASSIRD